MPKRTLWIALALFPTVALPLLANWEPNALLSDAPSRTAIWFVAYWWVVALAMFGIHWLYFALMPLFNQQPSKLWHRAAWAAGNLLLWPFAPPIYLWFCLSSGSDMHSTTPNPRGST